MLINSGLEMVPDPSESISVNSRRICVTSKGQEALSDALALAWKAKNSSHVISAFLSISEKSINWKKYVLLTHELDWIGLKVDQKLTKIWFYSRVRIEDIRYIIRTKYGPKLDQKFEKICLPMKLKMRSIIFSSFVFSILLSKWDIFQRKFFSYQKYFLPF